MALQTFVSFDGAIAFAGQRHYGCRNSFIRTAVAEADLAFGVFVVESGYEIQHPVVRLPEAGDTTFAGIIGHQHLQPRTSNSRFKDIVNLDIVYPEAGDHVKLVQQGIFWVVVEEQIPDTTSPVYVRVANPTGNLEGFGFARTDDDGGDAILVPQASWYTPSSDVILDSRKSGQITAAEEAARINLTAGYGVAAVRLNF